MRSVNQRLSVDAAPFLPFSLQYQVNTLGTLGNMASKDAPPPIKVKSLGSFEEPAMNIYEALDTVPFTPGMGVCTPSPTNWAMRNRLSPFEEGSPKYEARYNLANVSSTAEKRILQSPSSPFGCCSHNTISSNYSPSSDRSPLLSTSPDIPLENGYNQMYYHRYMYSNAYAYEAPSSWTTYPPENNMVPYHPCQWNAAYPCRVASSPIDTYPSGSKENCYLYSSSPRLVNILHAVLQECEDMDISKNMYNNGSSNKLGDKKLKVKNAQQCPDVSANGELKLNARQRRTLRRAQDRLFRALDNANMNLSRSSIKA